jgi:hypothetical protein
MKEAIEQFCANLRRHLISWNSSEGRSTDKYPKLTAGKAMPDVSMADVRTLCAGPAAWPGPQPKFTP